MSEIASTGRSGQRLGSIVLDELKERLLDGKYSAGSRISIEELKAEFGVSKQPVMDALRRLESIGLVEIIPQSGCRVAQYTIQEVRDFYHLFGSFEGKIAAAAAERRTDQQLLDLDAAWQRIEDLESTADPAARSHGYRFLNRDLHLVIHQMAHSRVMAQLSERLWDLSDFFISTIGGAQPISRALHERNHEHHVIRDAIKFQKHAVAEAAMDSHIVGTLDILGPRLVKERLPKT